MKNHIVGILFVVIVCIIGVYIYVINPFEKIYNLSLVNLIFFLLLIPISLVFRNKKRYYFTGLTVLVLIFVGVYFLL